jgi:multidrug efflux pump subunit AcrA (membrane-fusion protein)
VDIGRIRPDMPARITLDAYPKSPIPGRVFNIRYEGKNVSNVITYGVKIAPEKVPPFFRSQMTANVSLIIKRKENAVLVPAAAVRQSQDGEKEVLVPGPQNKPVPKPVTVGLESGETTEILSGVAPGDTILISQKRYSPQKAGSSSPLVGGGRPRQQEGQTGATRQRSGRP